MQRLKSLSYRLIAIAAGIAQAVVTSFGGGNGDPAVLHETIPSTEKRK
jgi:hypothetical protein